MFQLLASRIIDDAIQNDMRRLDQVDSDVIITQRRSASDARMTSQQMQQLVDAHNARRRSVGATNMELMVRTSLWRCVNTKATTLNNSHFKDIWASVVMKIAMTQRVQWRIQVLRTEERSFRTAAVVYISEIINYYSLLLLLIIIVININQLLIGIYLFINNK